MKSALSTDIRDLKPKMLDLEDMRKEVGLIYAEKLERIVNSVDSKVIKAHQQRLNALQK